MTDDRKQPHDAEIERAAEERRHDIEGPEEGAEPDSAGLFNPVEGVAPSAPSVPDKSRK